MLFGNCHAMALYILKIVTLGQMQKYREQHHHVVGVQELYPR